MENRNLRDFILRSIGEDLGDGDHSSLACIPWEAAGKARLLIKEEGILAGVEVAKETFAAIDKGSMSFPAMSFFTFREGSSRSLNQSDLCLTSCKG